MAKLSTEELLEAFKEMTLIELSEFVKQFEETFGVTAAAPVAVAAAPGAGGGAAGAPAEEGKGEFDVILPSAQTQLCNAQVACGGALLYGGPGAGFFPCAVAPPHVSGADSQTSSADRDGAMQIDTARGILAVQDDALGPRGAFALNARVTGVR